MPWAWISEYAPTAAIAEAQGGPRWTPEQLSADFRVIGFSAPFVVVRRKADRVVGTLEFTHHPRLYLGWQEAI